MAAWGIGQLTECVSSSMDTLSELPEGLCLTCSKLETVWVRETLLFGFSLNKKGRWDSEDKHKGPDTFCLYSEDCLQLLLLPRIHCLGTHSFVPQTFTEYLVWWR